MNRLLLFAVLLLSLLSCNNKDTKPRRSSGSTVGSAPWEMLIVADKEWLSGTYGSTIMDLANSEIPGLPQVESCFRTTTVNPRDFTNTFKVYANIIIADVNSKYEKPEMKLARDLYVHPQYILTITAPTNESFAQFVTANKEQILKIFVDAELNRERSFLNRSYSGKVFNEVKKRFGCVLKAPEDISAIKVGKNFIWGATEGSQGFNTNICVYSYPYTSTSTFTLDYFLDKRDSIMMENIRGGREDQYMATDRKSVFSKDINVNGRYVQEVRGLWQMENDFMGGPFISYSQVDTVNNRVLVVEGFVYAPEKKKRELIRELEASLQTLVLPSK